MVSTAAPSTIVLLSGGLDSAVLLVHEARAQPVWPVYVRVGLAWEALELAMIERLLAHPRLPRDIGPLSIVDFTMRDVYSPSHWAIRGEPPAYDTPDEDVYLTGATSCCWQRPACSRHEARAANRPRTAGRQPVSGCAAVVLRRDAAGADARPGPRGGSGGAVSRVAERGRDSPGPGARRSAGADAVVHESGRRYGSARPGTAGCAASAASGATRSRPSGKPTRPRTPRRRRVSARTGWCRRRCGPSGSARRRRASCAARGGVRGPRRPHRPTSPGYDERTEPSLVSASISASNEGRQRQRDAAVARRHVPRIGHRRFGLEVQADGSVAGAGAEDGRPGVDADAAVVGLDVETALRLLDPNGAVAGARFEVTGEAVRGHAAIAGVAAPGGLRCSPLGSSRLRCARSIELLRGTRDEQARGRVRCARRP